MRKIVVLTIGRPHTPYLRKEEIVISFWYKKKSSTDVSTNPADPIGSTTVLPKTHKEPNRRRSEKVTLRMTPEEREMLRSRASLAGLSQTDLIFSSIQNGIFIILDEALPLLIELRKQGINLNQVVRHLHQLDLRDPTILEQAIHSCVTAQTELVQFCRRWNIQLKKEADVHRDSHHKSV